MSTNTIKIIFSARFGRYEIPEFVIEIDYFFVLKGERARFPPIQTDENDSFHISIIIYSPPKVKSEKFNSPQAWSIRRASSLSFGVSSNSFFSTLCFNSFKI